MLETANETLTVVKKTPVLAGICGTDPFRNMSRLLQDVKDLGFMGVQNFPTVGLIDGVFRQNLEETRMVYGKEVEMIRLVHEMDLLTTPCVFNVDEAERMTEAGADIAHMGLTTSGTIGAQTALGLDDCIRRVQDIADAVKRINLNVIVLCHGGPIATSKDARYVIEGVKGVHGFFGASPLERSPEQQCKTKITTRREQLRQDHSRVVWAPVSNGQTKGAGIIMALLSDRQREELHKSMLEYLHANNFIGAYNALKEDSGVEYTPDPKAKYAGLLEKKWTSVIRLQKKIMDLETRNASLQEELSLAPSKRAAMQADWVPRAPAAHVLTGHRQSITRVAFHPQYSLLASASEDATVKIWDWETGEFERTLKGHQKGVNDVEFDHKGHLLVTCSSDLFIKIWDSQNEWKNVKTLTGHDHAVSSARFLPGDQFIVSASWDHSIRIFDVASAHLVRTIIGHTDWVRYVVPSDDGRLLASASKDQTARLWDPLTGEQKMELRGHDHQVEVVVFAPIASYNAIRELAGVPVRPRGSGAYVATGSRDKTIKLWDTQSGQMLKNLAGHDNWIRALVFHPSGKLLLSASDDKTIRIWELSTGRCMKTVEAHTHFVATIAWGRQKVSVGSGKTNGMEGAESKSGEPEKLVNVVASAGVDQMVKIWLP
ncbi:WD40-repeat-containing domain protein [Lanmaoa asiatica]|nr:WD40-repeat-containing domain protein [Lanmaoa asiatica]